MEKRIEINAIDNTSAAINSINQSQEKLTNDYLNNSRKRVSAAMEEINANKGLFDANAINIQQQYYDKITNLRKQFEDKKISLQKQAANELAELDSVQLRERNKLREKFRSTPKKLSGEFSKLQEKQSAERERLEKTLSKEINKLPLQEEKERINLLKEEDRQLKEFKKTESEYQKKFGAKDYIEAIKKQGGESVVEKTIKKDSRALEENYKKDIESINKKYSLLDKTLDNEAKRKKEILELDKKHRENLNLISDAESKLDKREESKSKRGRGWGHFVNVGETGINASITGIGNALSSGNVFGAGVNAIGAMASGVVEGVGGAASAGLNAVPYAGGFLSAMMGTITKITAVGLNAATQVASAAVSQYLSTEVPMALSKKMTGQTDTPLEFISNIQYYQFSQKFAQQRGGTKSRNAQRQTEDELKLERGLGYDYGAFSGLNRFERFTPNTSTSKDFEKFIKQAAASGLWNISEKNFSALGTILNQALIPLMGMETAFFDTVGGGKSQKLVKNFAQLAPSWQDPTLLTSRINMLDTGIKSPVNAFADQLVKSAIIKNNPNIGLMELKDTQAQGIMNPQTLTTILKGFEGLSNQNKYLSLMQMFPGLTGSYEARKALLENPDLISQGDVSEKQLAKRGIKKADWDALMTKLTETGEDAQIKINKWLQEKGVLIVNKISENLPDIKVGIESIDVTISKAVTFIEDISKTTKSIYKSVAGLGQSDQIDYLNKYEKEIEKLTTTPSVEAPLVETLARYPTDLYEGGLFNKILQSEQYKSAKDNPNEYKAFLKEIFETKKEIVDYEKVIDKNKGATPAVYEILKDMFTSILKEAKKSGNKEEEREAVYGLNRVSNILNDLVKVTKFTENNNADTNKLFNKKLKLGF